MESGRRVKREGKGMEGEEHSPGREAQSVPAGRLQVPRKVFTLTSLRTMPVLSSLLIQTTSLSEGLPVIL